MSIILIEPPSYAAPTQVWRTYLNGLAERAAGTITHRLKPAIRDARMTLRMRERKGWDKYPTTSFLDLLEQG